MGFDRLLGHERPIKLLRAMLSAERLPHALLFAGPSGVGKRTLALILAQAVNCKGDDRTDACGVCSACGKIERGVHPDVVEIQPEGKVRIIKVETIRDLRSDIAFRPFEGRTKVFIIREADRMNEAASNALLKTLEEPPPQSLIILTVNSESDLLPTIVSRCLRLKLAPLDRGVVEDWLKRIKGLDGAKARLLAALSGGCLGRVIETESETVWAHREQMVANLARLHSAKPGAALEWAAELAGNREDWPATFSLLRFWYRDLMIMAGVGPGHRLVNEDLTGELERIVSQRPPDLFASALTEIDRAEDALERLIRPELVFENLMLALADIQEGSHG